MSVPSRRPWYISLTLRWDDADPVGRRLLESLAVACLTGKAQHHLEVDVAFRHFTLLPLVRVDSVPPGFTPEDWLSEGLDTFHEPLLLFESWQGPIELCFTGCRVYDGSTALNFTGGERLEGLRRLLRSALWEKADDVARRLGGISELLSGGPKCVGAQAWSSIARSPSRSENQDALCWVLKQPGLKPGSQNSLGKGIVTFPKARLLVSNECLSNPLGQSDAFSYDL